MDHIEPDELAVLALDGHLPDGVARSHLDECVECLAEYESLARTVALARGSADGAVEAPSPAVWAAIHSELGLAPELAGDPLASVRPSSAASGPRAAAPPARPVSAAQAPVIPSGPAPVFSPEPSPTGAAEAAGTIDTTEATGGATGTTEATVTSLGDVASRRHRRNGGGGTGAGADARRTRRWVPIVAAAAVGGVLVGVALGAAAGGFGLFGSTDPTSVVASAQLDAFPGWSATGEALLEQGDDGVRSIVVELDAPVPAGDVREVWLIRSDASGLVSLGLLDGSSGRFAVPDGIDLEEFTLVDVSAEPVDGDPAHSGDSIVRGELRTT